MKQSIAIWTWIPGSNSPIVCGEFKLDDATHVGAFKYAAEYLGADGKIAIDPVNLPLKRSEIKTVLQNGVFGVFKDAGPDAWGRDVLFHEHGEMDDIAVLRLAPPDGCGAIVFGDAESKLKQKILTLEEIDAVILSQDFGKVNRNYAEALLPTTSLGGAKPKFTVLIEDEQWIMKLPEKGDSEFIAHNEHVMLEMAKLCGIDACESRIHKLPDGRVAFLVKRFDRDGDSRIHYASAHTVLGLGNPRVDTLAKKSYVRLADELKRWCKDFAQEDGKALWLRMVYNAMVGNADDHSKNHGLVYSDQDGSWRISKMFDVVAAPKQAPFALALAYDKAGAVVDLDRLVSTARNFGIGHSEAIEKLRGTAAIIHENWMPLMRKAGVSDAEIERLKTAFNVAVSAISHEFKADDESSSRRRYGR
jgi:serine/threonine-protein kinase HipA